MLNLPPYPANNATQWNGMTLEEIQMRRALVQARMEIQKFKLAAEVDKYRQGTSLFGGRNSVFSRVAGAFSFAEYALVAFKAFRVLAPMFKRKKR